MSEGKWGSSSWSKETRSTQKPYLVGNAAQLGCEECWRCNYSGVGADVVDVGMQRGGCRVRVSKGSYLRIETISTVPTMSCVQKTEQDRSERVKWW